LEVVGENFKEIHHKPRTNDAAAFSTTAC